MVGIWRAEVAAAATGAGTHSKTTEKHPASCKASAVSTTCTTAFQLAIKASEDLPFKITIQVAKRRDLDSTGDRLALGPEAAEHADGLWS